MPPHRRSSRPALSLLLVAPLAIGCTDGGTDKIGDLDTSPAGCDRIHGVTGVIVMSDGGDSNHFPTEAPSETLATTSVAGPTSAGGWFAIENGRLFTSTDGGCNWEATGGSIPSTGDWKLLTSGGEVYAFDRASAAVAHSTDGLSWSSGSSGEPLLGVPAADASIAGRLRGVTASGVTTSEDFGITWTPTGTAPPASPTGAATFAGNLDTAAIAHGGGVAITLNGGTTWEEIGADLVEDGFVPEAIAFATDDANTLWAAGADAENAMIYRSVDGGTSWSDVATSKSLDLDPGAPLWPVPGKPNEVLSAWASSADNYGINVYHIVAGENIHTTHVGSYYHVHDAAFDDEGSWLLAVDGVP